MFRETEYNRTLEDIGLLNCVIITDIILSSVISLLVLFHVWAWKDFETQFLFWSDWAALPIAFYLRHLLKKHLDRI